MASEILLDMFVDGFLINNLTLVLSTYLSKDCQSHKLKHPLKSNYKQWKRHLQKRHWRPPQDNLTARHIYISTESLF